MSDPARPLLIHPLLSHACLFSVVSITKSSCVYSFKNYLHVTLFQGCGIYLHDYPITYYKHPLLLVHFEDVIEAQSNPHLSTILLPQHPQVPKLPQSRALLAFLQHAPRAAQIPNGKEGGPHHVTPLSSPHHSGTSEPT